MTTLDTCATDAKDLRKNSWWGARSAATTTRPARSTSSLVRLEARTPT